MRRHRHKQRSENILLFVGVLFGVLPGASSSAKQPIDCGSDESCSAKSSGAIDSQQQKYPHAKPCGCGAEVSLSTHNLLDCAVTFANASFHNKDDGWVLAFTFLPAESESYARYSLSISSAHLASFGHGLVVKRNSKKDGRNAALEAEGSASDYTRRIRAVLELLQNLRQQGEPERAPQWILLLDPGTVIVAAEDVLRQALMSSSITNQTHIIASRHGIPLDGKHVLDAGTLLLRNAKWTEGFLTAWGQELSAVKYEKDPLLAMLKADAAFERATVRARRLGGDNAVIELSGKKSLSGALAIGATPDTEPVVHLKAATDEDRASFFKKLWEWSCNRPGGLWGRAPVMLQRIHRQALQGVLQPFANSKSQFALHRGSWPLKPEYHVGLILDRFARYLTEGEMAPGEYRIDQLNLCVKLFQWARTRSLDQRDGRRAGEKVCEEALVSLQRGREEQRASEGPNRRDA